VNAHDVTDEVKKQAGWEMFMGLLTAAVGVFLVVYPLVTATLTTVVLGWCFVLVAIAEFVSALHSASAAAFFQKVALCVLFSVSGLALAFFPLTGVAALTGFLGGLLVLQAGLQTATAFQLQPAEGRGWLLFNAFTSLLLGILILAGWPKSSVWAIGTLVGVSVTMGGITRFVIASRIRSGATHLQQLVHGAT
jgi:uncharacterized membrane protein HdeD (DUF308 family)